MKNLIILLSLILLSTGCANQKITLVDKNELVNNQTDNRPKQSVKVAPVESAIVETINLHLQFTENRIKSAIADIYGLDKMLKLPEKPKIYIFVNNKPTSTDNNWYVSVYQFIDDSANVGHSVRLVSYRINDSTGVVEKEDAIEGTYTEKVTTIKP